jgi:Winged helix DNA-binding domain
MEAEMTDQILTTRQLNRATLARQMLLERSARTIPEATAFLLGLQGQISEGPYQGLWSRLQNFRHEEMTALIVDKSLARATTMRATLHLHTAEDLLNIRTLVQPVISRMWQGQFVKRLQGLDTAAVLRAARRASDKGPKTSGDIGKVLKAKYPDRDKLALAVTVQVHETMVQVPPTRIWGSGHAPLLVRVENWLGEPLRHDLTRTQLVLRYLAAYGPASVADMQSWSGLTKLDADFEQVRDQLLTFRDDTGRELFDLPDAPRPEADTPAPVRFLPFYDNIYLGFADRRRMLDPAIADRINMTREFKAAVLVDGLTCAGWTLSVTRGVARLEVETYRSMSKREQKAIEREGLAFLSFMAEDAKSQEVVFI